MKDKETEALKPCPWCKQIPEDAGRRYFIHRDRAGCPIGSAAFSAKTWNTSPATLEDRALDALCQTVVQIEYLHGKFQETGSGNQVLAQARALLREAGRGK